MKNKGFVLAALALLTAAGCGSSKKTDDVEAEMARGSYSGEKNKVTVVRLERRTFNKQLVCNGKLDAQGKATLQFAQQGTIERINYREGQTVAAGAVVATLDKRQAEQQLKQSQLAYDKALLQLSDRLLDYNLTIADTATMPENQLANMLRSDPTLAADWDETYGDRMQKLVFIGQNLDKAYIKKELDACLTD